MIAAGMVLFRFNGRLLKICLDKQINKNTTYCRN